MESRSVVIDQQTLMRRFVILLAGWTAVTTLLSTCLPGSPHDAWFVLMVIGAMLLPPAVFVVAYRGGETVRDLVHRLDLAAVTAVQGMRIAGIAMLALWAAGAMSPAFALWAGGLDVFTGLTAVPVAFLVASRRSAPAAALRVWHCLGLLDFVVAIPLGVMLTPSALGALDGSPGSEQIFSFPLSFIPMVGVPFMIVMHLVALLQLRRPLAPVSPLLHAAEPARSAG